MTLTRAVVRTGRQMLRIRPARPRSWVAWVSEASSARSASRNPTMPAAGGRKAGHGRGGCFGIQEAAGQGIEPWPPRAVLGRTAGSTSRTACMPLVLSVLTG